MKSLVGATLQRWHTGLEQGVAFKNTGPSNTCEMLSLGTMSDHMSWTCCYEVTLAGTVQSRSYVVILVFRPYLLRPRAEFPWSHGLWMRTACSVMVHRGPGVTSCTRNRGETQALPSVVLLFPASRSLHSQHMKSASSTSQNLPSALQTGLRRRVLPSW